MNLTEHFSEAEFLRSATAEEYKIKNTWERPEHRDNAIKLCRELEKARELFGPLKITSGYRCPELNRRVGGASGSTHTKGMAADVYPLNGKFEELWEWAQKNWKGGHAINRKLKFIHLDIGEPRTWAY